MNTSTLIVKIREIVFENNGRANVCIKENGRISDLGEPAVFSKKELLNRFVSKENGFADVLVGSDKIAFAVDRIRTFPLFYAVKSGKLLISDDASWIRAHIGCRLLDNQAVTEFFQSGFIAGDRTLYKEIRTLQAGEYAVAHRVNDLWELSKERYFTYFSETFRDETVPVLLNELDHILNRIFSRIADVYRERRLVVPLSGGLDSRLIVSWLKRLGCENVQCYSFGTPSTRDCLIARKIAARLNYSWNFIHLTDKLWKKSYSCEYYHRLRRHYSGYCSLLTNHEFPVFIRMLEDRNLIPKEAVILPGHTGDFISGGHIPQDIHACQSYKEFTIRYILEKHFMLWNTINRKYRKAELTYLINRIENQIKHVEIDSAESVAQAIEYYDWQERQAKFIVQFVSIYKLFNYSFEMPLWSKDLIDFFVKIPMSLKIGKNLYIQYLKKYDPFDIFQGIPDPSHNAVTSRDSIKKDVRPHRLKKTVRTGLKRFYKLFGTYFTNDYNYYAPFSFGRIILNLGQHRNPNSFHVQDFLRDVRTGLI